MRLPAATRGLAALRGRFLCRAAVFSPPPPVCRLQYDKLQTDLQQASTAASRLAEENCELKSREDAADPALGAGVADPLAVQQVARQMEALLVEKSKLVQENDRLLRENTGLQVGGPWPRWRGSRRVMGGDHAAASHAWRARPPGWAPAGAAGVHAATHAAGGRRGAVWVRRGGAAVACGPVATCERGGGACRGRHRCSARRCRVGCCAGQRVTRSTMFAAVHSFSTLVPLLTIRGLVVSDELWRSLQRQPPSPAAHSSHVERDGAGVGVPAGRRTEGACERRGMATAPSGQPGGGRGRGGGGAGRQQGAQQVQVSDAPLAHRAGRGGRAAAAAAATALCPLRAGAGRRWSRSITRSGRGPPR